MRKSAHSKDGDKTVLGMISNKRNNFQSIYIGQANFEQDYVRRMFFDFVNCTCPGMSNLGLKAREFKLLAQGSRLLLLLVNYENGLFGNCTHRQKPSQLIRKIGNKADILSYLIVAFAMEPLRTLVIDTISTKMIHKLYSG